MNSAIQSFIQAHEYCRVLERVLLVAAGEEHRIAVMDELTNAYRNLDLSTQAIVAIGFAEAKHGASD